MANITRKTQTTRLLRELPGILGPLLLTVAVAVVVLRLLNVIPDYWQRLTSGPKPAQPVLNERLEFPSIRAAEEGLQVQIATPTYFPSKLIWPPASIRGQKEPARVVSLLFLDSDGRQALQIREIYSPGEQLPFPIPEPAKILERRDVIVNGADGQLLLGRAIQEGTPVNQLRWQVNGVHLVVTTVLPPEELMRIGKSIHPE